MVTLQNFYMLHGMAITQDILWPPLYIYYRLPYVSQGSKADFIEENLQYPISASSSSSL